MAELKTRIKHKNGTPDEWSQATNFSPLKGELVVYNDTTNPRMKIGDGETNVNDLPFINNAFVTVDLDGADDGEDFVPDDNLVINAETLGGKPASSYMLKTDIATDSNKLGGKLASDYALKADAVFSVNGVEPDSEGNVGLTIDAITASKTTVSVRNEDKYPGIDIYGSSESDGIQKGYQGSIRLAMDTDHDGYREIELVDSTQMKACKVLTEKYGTAVNSQKFGGKAPEYYLTPVNLLDNSWFGGRYVGGVKEGIVCQVGLNGLHGTTKYPMDRWISWNLDAGFADGYITVNSPYDQRLDPNKIDANKVYTVAACFADGTITCSSGVASANIGGYANIGLYFNYNNGAPYVRMWHNAADNYRWVALYEGQYTAETLPPYIPKGYAVELAECMRYAHVIGADKWLLGSQVFGAGVMVPITISTAMRKTPSAIGTWQAYVANTGWVDLTFWSVTYNAQTGFVHGIVFAGLEESGVNAGDTVIVKGIDGLYCDL